MKVLNVLKLSCVSLILLNSAQASGVLSPITVKIAQNIQQCDDKLTFFKDNMSLFSPKPLSPLSSGIPQWKPKATKLEFQKKRYEFLVSELDDVIVNGKKTIKNAKDRFEASSLAQTLNNKCNQLSDNMKKYIQWVQNENSISSDDAKLFEENVKKSGFSH